MSDQTMTIGDRELQRIGDYVKGNLRGWMDEVGPQSDVITQLLERSVRIEEELRGGRQLMEVRFEAVDRRFEAVDRRFEEVNTRFEDMNTRFEDMNTRFEDMNTRFEDMNARFGDTNNRFEDMNNRFGDMDRRFSGMQWLIGVGLVVIITLMSVYEFIT